MDENVERLTEFMSKGDEKLIQIDDRLFKVEKTSTDHKFDIDKLVARANQAFESLKKHTNEILTLNQETATLGESKAD